MALRFAGADVELASGQALTMRSVARRLPALVRRVLAMAWERDRAALAVLLVAQAVSGVAGAFGLLATTAMIQALVTSGDLAANLGHAVPSVAVLASMAATRAVLGNVVRAMSERIGPKLSRAAERKLVTTGTGAEYAAYDNPGYNDRWEAADRGANTARDLLGDTQNMIASLASVAAAAAVLCTVHPLLLVLLLVAALPQLAAGVMSARIYYMAFFSTWALRRMLSQLRFFQIDRSVADQVRTNTLAPYLLSRYDEAWDTVEASNDRAAWRSARTGLAGSAAAGVASAVVWGALWWLLAHGHISLAAAGTAVPAMRNASASMEGATSYGASLYRNGMYLADWQTFIDEAAGHRLARGSLVPAAPETIEFRGVAYRYPDADRPALDGIELTLTRGEITAVVGINGSGKSTLVKLACGLLLPTEGQVLWDGVDIRELDAEAMWRQCSVVPQDFAHWPMTCRENIQLGQPTRTATKQYGPRRARPAPTRRSPRSGPVSTPCWPSSGGAEWSRPRAAGSAWRWPGPPPPRQPPRPRRADQCDGPPASSTGS
ncbi:ATP-binding cassette domain-containing protein [Kitasatospora sp. NPDC057223]|uniref:ATP-binding cassette domain-containing protein n=1 Tax=Kitasatospora sp. NPDC057223 TaxID=3346055 RepID=UPI0036348DD4